MNRDAVRILAIAIALTMVVGAFVAIAPAWSAPSHLTASTENEIICPDRELISPKARTPGTSILEAYSEFNAADGGALAAPGNIYPVGSRALFNVNYGGKWYYNETDPTDFMPFTKRAESNHSELWTCDDMTFPDGDLRNTLTSQLTITEAKAKYMVQHYEEVIYPNMTAMFGQLPSNDGTNSVPASEDLPFFGTNVSGRLMIMVFNLVDQNFFDPEWPRAYYGYFDPWADWYYDRNIIHVDSWDWTNRTTGSPPYPSTASPYDFEATIAHELEHIITSDANPNQVPFVDEGCAMYSEVLCGYAVQDIPYANSFLHTPDISLTAWSSQGEINSGASYGAAMLFVTYLADHFGAEMIQNLVDSYPSSGMDSVNYAFEQIGRPDWDFDKAFQYWRLANLILSDSPGQGWFNYDSLDLRTTEIGAPFQELWYPGIDPSVDSAADYFGTTVSWAGYSTGVREVGVYGTDYIHVMGMGPGWSSGFDPFDLKLAFAGDSMVVNGWQKLQIPAEASSELYDEDFDHGGAMPSGWEASHPAVPDRTNVVGGGPWHVESAGGGDYYVAVDGPSGPLSVGELQYDALTSVSYDTMGLTYAQVSFDLSFHPGGEYDFARVRYSVDGGYFVTLQRWDVDIDERVTIDISDLTGFDSLELMFDFTAYAPGGRAEVDDMAIDPLDTRTAWWSGVGDLQDFSLMTELDLTALSQAVLTLDTMWSIEDYFDFGFVQVSADGGQSWTSVENEWTTYDYYTDQEAIYESMPGITGSSDGWVSISYDLSAWAGSSVLVRLRYMTDQYTFYDGWYVSDSYLNGEVLDSEAWASSTPPLENSWMVTLYLPGSIGLESQVYMLPIMAALTMNEALDTALRTVASFTEYPEMYIMVSPIVGESDYGFALVQGTIMP